MCGRFTRKESFQELAKILGISDVAFLRSSLQYCAFSIFGLHTQ